MISDAGPLLGYVHLDDNDGSRDLHLGLTDGILTEAVLADSFAALKDIVYNSSLSLELHPGLPDPLDALRRSREVGSACEAVKNEHCPKSAARRQ